MSCDVFVLGSFVADAAYRAPRLPASGETLLGSRFSLGPGGKGSNQAVAAARAGARVSLLTKIGADPFGDLGRQTWASEGLDCTHVIRSSEIATGSAAILIHEATGENAIIVVPGACATLTPENVDAAADSIRSAKAFLTQLEIPLAAVQRGLELARAAGVTTILNPAPAQPLPDQILRLVDFLIPNETEAAQLAGFSISTPDDLYAAAISPLGGGVKNVLITLGEHGALFCAAGEGPTEIPVMNVGPVIDTTGAGDAFCGAFAVGLAEGHDPIVAARFASAAAGISVTRHGTAVSMPHRPEIDALLRLRR